MADAEPVQQHLQQEEYQSEQEDDQRQLLRVEQRDDQNRAEVIRDGENGFLVPISDEHALAQRVLTLLRDPELAHTMGARGWEIGRRYDVRYAVQRLGELYRELAANCPPYSITN